MISKRNNKKLKKYNFDQKAENWITLEDVLGKDYAQIAEQSVRQQIEQRETEDGNAGSAISSKENAGTQQAETSEKTTELRDDYKDNFDVDEKAVTEFGRMIKEAVVQKDVEELLSDEMVSSIAQADENNLSPSMAGFTLYGSNGAPSITFGVREGRLAISGINYSY